MERADQRLCLPFRCPGFKWAQFACGRCCSVRILTGEEMFACLFSVVLAKLKYYFKLKLPVCYPPKWFSRNCQPEQSNYNPIFNCHRLKSSIWVLIIAFYYPTMETDSTLTFFWKVIKEGVSKHSCPRIFFAKVTSVKALWKYFLVTYWFFAREKHRHGS